MLLIEPTDGSYALRRYVATLSKANLILVDADICAGKPVITGTRVPVEYVVRMARKGYSVETIAKEFDLPTELVKQVLHVVQENAVVKFA